MRRALALLHRIHRPASAALASLLVLLIVLDSIPHAPALVRLTVAALTLLIIATGVVTVGTSIPRLRLLIPLGALAAAGFLIDNPAVAEKGLTSLPIPLFLWSVVALLVADVFRAGRAPADRLLAALNLYVLGAFGFAYLYSVIETVAPGSFRLPDAAPPEQTDLLYFSFVTQTTLGYGDISPVAPHARAVAIVQSTTGVLFLAIVVAAIVGQSRQPNDP